MLTLASLKKHIESRFTVGKSTNHSRSVTGEPYVVIGEETGRIAPFPGVVREGMPQECGFDEETACLAAVSSFNLYAEGKTGVLYWRDEPALDWNDDHSRCRVWLRLLISDKPAREREFALARHERCV